jgi:hypothetical protein
LRLIKNLPRGLGEEGDSTETKMRSPFVKLLLGLCAGLALASCVTTGLYQSADVRAGRAGYAETRFSEAAWRVEFVGDDFTSRETVETYLLYRSAELTVENGYDWFASSAAAGDEETEIVVEAQRPDLYRAHYWRPNWRRRSRFFWSDLDPVGPIPREPREPQIHTNEHYSASADIRLGRGAAPEGAFDARQILQQLAPSIVRPQS